MNEEITKSIKVLSNAIKKELPTMQEAIEKINNYFDITSPKEKTMIKLNTPKEVHEAMWKDGARYTTWNEVSYIKFSNDGRNIIEQSGENYSLNTYVFVNDNIGYWTPYIPPKKEQMTDDEMLAIIAKKPWIKFSDCHLCVGAYDLNVNREYITAATGHEYKYDYLRRRAFYSYDLIEWKEFVK